MTEKDVQHFRIRLESRLKNDTLIKAREQLNMTQEIVAGAIGISQGTYSAIERMNHYPSENLQQAIIIFYGNHGISLNFEELFPEELRKAKFNKKYVITTAIPPLRLLSLSTLDKKLLLPVEIDDEEIREEDIKIEVNDMLKTITGVKNIPRMIDTIKMSFGLSPYDKQYEDAKIAKKYNLSRERIRQIRNQGIRKLRKRNNYFRSFLEK